MITDTLMLVEHNPVITVGRRTDASHLLTTKEYLASKGVALHTTERGGEATYHGPGQAVCYLIADMAVVNHDVRQFIWNLEEAVIRVLSRDYDLQSGRAPEHRGVWIDDKKIAAVGVAFKHGVSMHGIALNVNVDMTPFSYIVPCGIPDRGVTSLREVRGAPAVMTDVFSSLAAAIKEVFVYE